MDSEDEMSNLSERRDNSRHVHYADTSITSSNSESSEMDKYLDEAIENDDDDEFTMNRPNGKPNAVSRTWTE